MIDSEQKGYESQRNHNPFRMFFKMSQILKMSLPLCLRLSEPSYQEGWRDEGKYGQPENY